MTRTKQIKLHNYKTTTRASLKRLYFYSKTIDKTLYLFFDIPMSIEKVREFFKQFNLDDKIQEFKTSSATVELAAIALNTQKERIAKTLSFKDKEEGCILVVCAGDKRIDNKKFKTQFQIKAKMLSPQEALDYTGHAIGGVCPFAINNPKVKIYCDISLKRFETIFPACGSSNSAIELTPNDLLTYSNSKEWIDICQ